MVPQKKSAVVANFVVSNDGEETTYLQEYFGQAPDQYQLARFPSWGRSRICSTQWLSCYWVRAGVRSPGRSSQGAAGCN
jgi:hypothetical protein